MVDSREIAITFLGGASEIGASCVFVEIEGTRLVIDCGVRFNTSNPLPNLDFLSSRPPDAILVTHAHTDHTGALPVLHDAFPNIPVYMTPPTIDLVRILLRDTLRLMNKVERESELPLYSEKQVEGLLETIHPIHPGEHITVGNTAITFYQASHIIGAAMIHLDTPAGTVLFTGDFSVSGQLTVPDLVRPNFHTDCIVSESTYGTRLHSDRRVAEKRLLQQVTETIIAGGKVLIPAFAIGRAQEVVLMLRYAQRNRRIPAFPIYVDGMIRAVCNVYSHHERYVSHRLLREIHREKHPFFSGLVSPVSHPDQRERILNGEPCAIIASSGMLWGGPSQYYARTILEGEKNALLITGYQDEESPGRRLLDLIDNPAEARLLLDGNNIDVKARVDTFNLSAHADRLQICGLIESLKPRTVIFVHGDQEARQSLKDTLSSPRDIILIEEGQTVIRSYPRRKQRKTSPARRTHDITRETALSIVGPATGQPLERAHLLFAWFGREVSHEESEILIRQLIEYEVVKEDDKNSSLLWPLTHPGRGAKASIEDIALEEQLKKENPKGKLLEFCSRSKIGEPERLSTIHKGCPVVELKLNIGDTCYSSDPVFALSEKIAEHLAARKIIQQLTEKLLPEEYSTLSEARVQELKKSNPKGKLLEHCMKERDARSLIRSQPVIQGFISSACIELNDGRIITARVFLGSTAKIVEHAAAADLLDKLETLKMEGVCFETNLEIPEKVQTVKSNHQPIQNLKILLNHLRQTGIIQDFGYEEIDKQGPSHQPVFLMRGWYQTVEGNKVFTEIIETGNIKKGQTILSEVIYELLT